MLYLGRRRSHTWNATVFAPPREIFTVAAEVTALPPFQFQPLDDQTAEVSQTQANSLFGGWRPVAAPRNRVRIHCEPGAQGTRLTVTATGDRAAIRRATNLVRIVTAGEGDRRTIYRLRTIPVGPCTLVQSWAGTSYPVFLAPDPAAPRGAAVRTASLLWALEQRGPWVRVRIGGRPEPGQLPEDPGAEGWIEADELVGAPDLTGRAGVSVSPMGHDRSAAAPSAAPAGGVERS